jgi:hypothetical protein
MDEQAGQKAREQTHFKAEPESDANDQIGRNLYPVAGSQLVHRPKSSPSVMPKYSPFRINAKRNREDFRCEPIHGNAL